MNTAKYLSTLAENGGNGLYPLSIQALNFIQEQITLLQRLAAIGGKRYILVAPTASTDGIVVIDGEVLPLQATGSPGKGIKVEETTEDILADGVTYSEARVRRYARYVSTYTANTPNLYAASEFNGFATNMSLNSRFQDYTGLEDAISKRLMVLTGTFTSAQLDAAKDNIRIHCKTGSVVVNGAATYTINVYNNGASLSQEQLLPNMQSYKREYNFASNQWGPWTFCTENLHLEVKVKNKTTVYVRHGVIPEGVQLVLLRKKPRGAKRRSGGQTGSNANYRGKVRKRQAKTQYVHFKQIVLSTGEPNKWYVPKCLSAAGTANQNLVGKELPTLCATLIYAENATVYSNGRNEYVFRIQGQRKKVSFNGVAPGSVATGYAKIALQLATTSENSKSPGGEIVQMKYRLFFDKNTLRVVNNHQAYHPGLRAFSVE